MNNIMSGIDKILKDLENIPDNENVAIEVKELKDEVKNELPKIDDDKELNKQKKKVRRKIKELEKKAGKDEDDAKKITKKLRKAKGTGGGNDSGVRCYIRYNNRGNPYRICDDGKNPANKKKPPSVITPAISPEEFADKFGGYANLSKEQQRTYHRLYMRRVRKEESGDAEAGEQLASVVRAKKRLGKQQARQKKLEEQQKKIEKRDKIFKFKNDLKTNYTKITRGDNRGRLLKKYGLTEGDIKRKAKTLEENQNEIKEVQENIETEQEFIDKNIKKLDTGGIAVESTGKSVIVGFE